MYINICILRKRRWTPGHKIKNLHEQFAHYVLGSDLFGIYVKIECEFLLRYNAVLAQRITSVRFASALAFLFSDLLHLKKECFF